mgnify:FL=1|tara:strand:- start:1772 stop:2041 length:270 start_codon:yes stop_codon:yes gene_type:complete
MISKDLKITNKLGLHARAAAKVVDIANKYKCEINLLKDDKIADARSIMKLLMLSASQGTHVKVQINGDNQDDAMSSIEKLFNEKFNEEE